MSNEIKLDKHSVDALLNELNEATDILNGLFSMEVKGSEHLSTIGTINEINHSYQQLILNYQAVLTKHISVALKSLQSMSDTDQSLANYNLLQNS